MFVTCGVIWYDFVLTLKLSLFLCDIYICFMFSFGKIFLNLAENSGWDCLGVDANSQFLFFFAFRRRTPCFTCPIASTQGFKLQFSWNFNILSLWHSWSSNDEVKFNRSIVSENCQIPSSTPLIVGLNFVKTKTTI